MRLTPIEAPNPTFADDDFLNRKPTGDQLTGLIKRIDSPLVIAVDGEWGSGKSHFLKCWKNDPADGITKIYVDAFKQDYLDDPLIALVSALDEGNKDNSLPEAAVKKVKELAPWLGRTGVKAAANVGATLLTGIPMNVGGMTEQAIDSVIQKSGDELSKSAENFWKADTSRIAAMDGFKQALTELTKPDGDKKPTHKIAIIIDELDRCRPDYALNMIEVIKHFFEIDGINFVLGVNMSSLENSVKARYGAGIDAKRYLQKFVQLKVRLRLSKQIEQGSALSFFNQTIETLSIDPERAYLVRTYIEQMERTQDLPLRNIIQVISNCIANGHMNKLAIRPISQMEQALIVGLQFLKVMHPAVLVDDFANTITFPKIQKLLGVEPPTAYSADEVIAISRGWCLCLDGGDENHFRFNLLEHLKDTHGSNLRQMESRITRASLDELILNKLDTISLAD